MSAVTLPNGTVLTRVSRESCLARVKAITLGSFMYSQTRIEPSTGKRADCTGWVSYVWDTPDAGPGIYLRAYNTASFVTQRAVARIEWADLLPGDVIGYLSPTSPGNGGHAAVWMGGDRRPDGRFDVCDHGSGWGPKRRLVQWDGVSTGWLHPNHLAPWRYVAMIASGGNSMLVKLGDSGPEVQAMQLMVMECGGNVGSSGADGVYGKGTAAGLAGVVGGTGLEYGPVEYTKLHRKVGALDGAGVTVGAKVTSTITAIEPAA